MYAKFSATDTAAVPPQSQSVVAVFPLALDVFSRQWNAVE